MLDRRRFLRCAAGAAGAIAVGSYDPVPGAVKAAAPAQVAGSVVELTVRKLSVTVFVTGEMLEDAGDESQLLRFCAAEVARNGA